VKKKSGGVKKVKAFVWKTNILGHKQIPTKKIVFTPKKQVYSVFSWFQKINHNHNKQCE